MAEPDCEVCGLMGYRACDRCGSPTFDGGDVCGACADEDQADDQADDE